MAGPALGAKGYMFFDVGMTLTEEGEGQYALFALLVTPCLLLCSKFQLLKQD